MLATLDFGLIGEAVKLIGGGAAGWTGRLLTERNKRRKLRRGLYREMLRNYRAVRYYVDAAKKMRGLNAPLRGVTVRSEIISTDYFEHAKKDMDVFTELGESASFDWFYRTLQSVMDLRASGANGAAYLFNNACRLVHTTEEGFVAGTLDLKFAKKVLDNDNFRFLSQRVDEMRARGIPADEFPQ